MWGILVGALLVAAGAVLVIHGSLSLDAARDRQHALLYSTVLSSSSLAAINATNTAKTPTASRNGNSNNDAAQQSFLSSASFSFAMDAPVYTSFYLFNLTNGAQVLSGAEPPRVQQIGPYTYEKRSRKVNVRFHATPFPSIAKAATATTEASASSASSYGYVSYQVVSSYFFSPERSNGTETDKVVTVNITYARTLQKLRSRGYSERFLVAEFAQQHVAEYARHLRQEFIANAKLRAWTQFLPGMVQYVNEEVLSAVIKRQRQRVDSASIPANLVRAYALARTEMTPRVLSDVHRDISDQFLPEILQTNLDTAKRQALPRVLSNLYQRLKVESVPYWLQKQLASQQMRHVPMTLSSLAMKIESIALPYVLKEVYDRSCLEAVPSILRTIKSEIVAQDIATNRIQADTAQRNVVENWRKQGSTPTDFDAWFDDAPTGTQRTGFELLPSSPSLQLSLEAASLVLGSKVSNRRFSIVDYDTQVEATYPLGQPTTTPEGFGIWKQVIVMNETAITYVLQGVNNDVALVSDYLTREQLLFIRQYLINWAASAITQRDRERFWRQTYTKRTSNSDQNESRVDLDIEKAGVQTGFNLEPSGASMSGITAAVTQQLWSSTSEFSLVNPQGFTKWASAISGSSISVQALQAGVPGLTTAQITEVGAWIQGLLADGFIKRRALRHWSDGTCNSVLGLPLPSCLLYDLEPGITGDQNGFEMNPSSKDEWKVTQALRETLWNQTSSASFLVSAHMSNTALGFGIWLRGIRTFQFTRLVNDVQQPSMTVVNAQAISEWLETWSNNELNVLNVYNWWRLSTCLKRETLTVMSLNTVTTANLQTCTESYNEVEKSSNPATTSNQSPFFTTTKTFAVTETICTLDAATETYTSKASTYDTSVNMFSCDTISTSLADDKDESTFRFELMPSTPSGGSDRVSLAAAMVLWDPLNSFSFVNAEGYKNWYATALTDGGDTLQAINDAIDEACLHMLGGGERSAVFNETLAAMSCEKMSKAQYENVQDWVRAHKSSDWIQNALLDQWRRGAAEELEIEPYRDGSQWGWELAGGCLSTQCVLSDDNGTVYQIPRDALSLWDSNNSGSFLQDGGWHLWATLSSATASSDSATTKTAKEALVAACKASKWESWMQSVFDWLVAWIQSEHLLRDVLGHWIHAQCPTTPTFVSVVQKSADVVTTVTSCPPVDSRYMVALKDTIVDLQLAASRPTEFFKPDIVETSAKVQPKKVVEVDESWTTCEGLGPSSFKQTVSFQKSLKEFQACNFLGVMANATVVELATNAGSSFQPLLTAQAEATFEMNMSTASMIPIDIAGLIWNQSTPYAFTNLTVFLKKWHSAINHVSMLEAITSDLDDETHTQSPPTDLTPVQDYLKMWESSSISTRRVGVAWLSQSGSPIDLDASADGIQAGFELFPSGAWHKIAVAGGESLPTFDQGQYLWRATNAFSFLNMEGKLTEDGLPTGFSAWKEIYEGVDYSSEQLVQTYPPEAKVERQAAMQYSLPVDQRKTLLSEMEAQTTLTELQLRGIAGWLMDWSSNVVLRDYILHQWATGSTPRGEKDVTINLANYIGRLFGFSSGGQTLPHDLFTVASPLLESLSPLSRRNLWDYQKSGSLLNPTTQVIWCTIAATGDPSQFCPSILDDFGVISQSALESFKTIVQALISSQEEITKYSNLTKLSVTYLQTQFEIDEEQAVAAIASWWRQLPESSAFFQANQLRTWRSIAATVSKDPLRFGFGLGFVFPLDETVPRNSSATDLVANTVDLGASALNPLSACSESLEFLFSLWDSSNPVSFLHPDGIQQWRKLFEHKIDEAAFLQFIDASRATSSTATIIKSAKMTSDDISCALQATTNWLASWQQHPYLRQFVEFLWLQSPKSGSSSALGSPLLKDASALLKAFPLDATTSKDAIQMVETDKSLALWANFTRAVLDPSQASSLVDPKIGSPIWRSLLVSCFSSDASSGTCQNLSSSSFNEAYESGVSTAKVALKVLSETLWDQMCSFSGGTRLSSQSVDPGSLELMINARVVPWMTSWLDHPLFEKFVLDHAQEVDPSLKTQMTSFRDLAMAQFANSSVTLANYSIPTVLGVNSSSDNDNAENMDVGVASERFVRQELIFDAVEKTPILWNSSFLPGFGELKAFCDRNNQDVMFAYDGGYACKLNVDYTVSIKDANALMAIFSDATPWEWTKSNETVLSTPELTTRGALLIDAFLAQPFISSGECEFLVKNIAAAYKLSVSQQQQACVQAADGIFLNLPVLSETGFASKLRSYTTDFQAYLRYAATKFVYEPRVLGIQASAEFVSKPAGSGALKYPVGGYLASQNVSSVLFGSATTTTNSGIWKNDSSLPSFLPPQLFTLQVPLANDSVLFQKKSRVIGEILAIDNATEVFIWGEKVTLSAVHVTDGSQFTTAILSQKYMDGTKDFPPAKLLFYWEYSRRFVQAEYVRNVTRFGIPLMRYTVSSWLNPTTLPSGIRASDSTTAMLNMSLLQDDLQLTLSDTTPGLGGGEPAEITIDVDPLTGSVYHQRLVWQLNAHVSRDAKKDAWHKNIKECWIPVVWIQEQSSVSPTNGLSLAQVAKPGSFAKEKIATWEVIGGSVYIIVGTALTFFYARQQRMLYLHHIRSVLPEQTVCLLEDEASVMTASASSSGIPITSSDVDVKPRLRYRENNTMIEFDPQLLSALRSTKSSSSTTAKEEQLLRLNASSGSRSGRSGKRKSLQRVQTIVEQTDGVGDGMDSNASGGTHSKERP